MNDLISKSALLASTDKEEIHKYEIALFPTIDTVPVVRCKDCEFYTEEERWCRRLGLCGAFDPNGYCSHAERSEE